MKRYYPTHNSLLYIRNFIFGVEDSLVSTVGLLSGIAVAGVPQKTLLLTGIVLICVEAFSMGVGSFLSEDTIEEAEQDKNAQKKSATAALVMFGSYILSGFIPLLPYFFTYSSSTIWISVTISFTALFGLGLLSGTLFRIHPLKSGFRMLILGGLAILVGVTIGQLVSM